MRRVAATMQEPAPTESWELQRLYADHGAYIHTLVKRLLGPCGDAEDLTQEVFIVALRKLPEFFESSPRGWLAKIAVKLARNARQTFRLRRILGLSLPRDLVERRDPESTASAREATRSVYAVLDALSEKKRSVFILFEMQGLDCSEIAQLLGTPLATVYTRLHHARREFAAHYLRGHGADGADGGAGKGGGGHE